MKKLTILITAILLNACTYPHEQRHTYTNIVDAGYFEGRFYSQSDHIVFDIDSKKVALGHVEFNFIDCSDEIWECTSYGLFLFAKPKGSSGLNDKWTYENTNFTVLDEIAVSVLGKRIACKQILIRDAYNEPDGNFILLLYSQKHGLVGFIKSEEDEGITIQNTYLLADKTGVRLL
ncbi:hypothetical protein [Kangiella sp.]|uniref:hypothetical protein n=1 Tax=Kangiella sp. TaxID=1920245 RepID=UPI003A8E72E5